MRWFPWTLFAIGLACFWRGTVGLFLDCKTNKKLLIYAILGYGGLAYTLFIVFYFDLR